MCRICVWSLLDDVLFSVLFSTAIRKREPVALLLRVGDVCVLCLLLAVPRVGLRL